MLVPFHYRVIRMHFHLYQWGHSETLETFWLQVHPLRKHPVLDSFFPLLYRVFPMDVHKRVHPNVQYALLRLLRDQNAHVLIQWLLAFSPNRSSTAFIMVDTDFGIPASIRTNSSPESPTI